MLFILFSPSESKRQGGELPPIDKKSFILEELFGLRMQAVSAYENYLDACTPPVAQEFFGIKNPQTASYYKTGLRSRPTAFAIERYDGVAYEKLDYFSLDEDAKRYVQERTLIFSNLFGPVSAGDLLPDYRFRQGAKLPDFCPEKFFKQGFSASIDGMLKGADVLDLRAGFYDKFYAPPKPCATMKFLQNGRVVSHWAKVFRGLVLRSAALVGAKSLDELWSINIDGLKIVELTIKNGVTEATYEIAPSCVV